MSRLQDFQEQADAESRMLCNQELARSLASRMSLDGPRGTRQREPAEIYPRCKSCRALSLSPASTSATAPALEAVASPAFNSRQYDRQATSFPIDLALPRFTAKDFQLGPLESEYPASPPSLASQSLCLNVDTLSSDESEAGTGGVPVVEPIVISDQKLTVMSVHSGDPDLDLSDVDSPSSVSPIPSAIPAGVLESPSHYPTPTVPIELSAVSSVLLLLNRVRKGVWRPLGGPSGPGLLPSSSCNNCMNRWSCLPGLPGL